MLFCVLILVFLLSSPAYTLKKSAVFPIRPNGKSLFRMALPSDPAIVGFVTTSPRPSPSPYISPPNSRDVLYESDIFTGSSHRVSGNVIEFPRDVMDEIALAKTRGNRILDIFAVHVNFSGIANLQGIAKVRVMAHTCTVHGNVWLSLRPSSGRPPQGPKAPPLVVPAKGKRGADAGDVEIICRLVNSGTSAARLTVISTGAPGAVGTEGGDGTNGVDGTVGSRGRCKRRFLFLCRTTRGSPGRNSTPGRNGAKGGNGGDGGGGGSFIIFYNRFDARVNFSLSAAGGPGGPGGAGGRAGQNGKLIQPINYITRCGSKCRDRTMRENRPILSPTRSGARGLTGFAGKRGVSSFRMDLGRGTTPFQTEDYLRLFTLLERYYNDLVLSGSSCEEAISITETMVLLASSRSDNVLLANMARKAGMAAKSIRLQKQLFGPASRSRAAPVTIEMELRRDLDYAEAINDQIENLRIETSILSVLTQTTSIAIPRTDYNALRRDLRVQRNIFKAAVLDVENRIESAQSEINSAMTTHINRKKDGADRVRQTALFKGALSLINLAVGIGSLNFKTALGSLKGTISAVKEISVRLKTIEDDFKRVGKAAAGVKEFIGNVTKVNKHVREVKKALDEPSSSSCSVEDLRKLLVAAPDQLDKFPNLVDLDADFSKIVDIGVVSELSQALTTNRASSLTNQFACLLGENLDSVANVNAAFTNYFTLARARIGILGRMVDIDIEAQRLTILEEGVQAQKNELEDLRDHVATTSRGGTLLMLSILFERARTSVIETTEKLAASFSNIVLKPVDADIRTHALERLNQNGLLGFSSATQFANLRKLENDVVDRFQGARRCTTRREVPVSLYFSFDVTAESSPELFTKPLGTGPQNRSTLVLDIERNCAFYRSSRPATRGMANTGTGSICVPNKVTFNSRMTSIAVELLGGDESLLAPGRRDVFATIDQIGRQDFHVKPGMVTSFEVDPLQFGLGALSLTKSGPADIPYSPVCVSDGGLRVVNLDEPRVCPSPFSTYSLQLGFFQDKDLEAFLGTVKTIRVHTKLVSFTNAATATVCFDG